MKIFRNLIRLLRKIFIRKNNNYRYGKNDNSLWKSFTLVLKEEDTQNTLAGIAEVGLDTFINSGAYKDIPLLSSLLGPARVIYTIKEYFFVEKLAKFFSEVNTFDLSNRREMVNRIDQDSEYQEFIGKHLMLALDRYTQVEKAQALAKLLRAYIDSKINRNEFLKYSYIIDSIDWNLIPHLQLFYFSRQIDDSNFFYSRKYDININMRVISYDEKVEFSQYLGLPIKERGRGRGRFRDRDLFPFSQVLSYTGLISLDSGKVHCLLIK